MIERRLFDLGLPPDAFVGEVLWNTCDVRFTCASYERLGCEGIWYYRENALAMTQLCGRNGHTSRELGLA